MTNGERVHGAPLPAGIRDGANSDRLTQLVEAACDATPISGLTHNFYRYPARFSPKLVRAAIAAFTNPGDLVLDPFVGGGTTLVEALVSGRNAIGADISSLATFVSEVKTTLYVEWELQALQRWAEQLSEINIFAPVKTDSKYQDAGYLRHLDGIKTWRLRKAIDQALDSACRLAVPRLEAFARCVILRTAQWALDGRKKLTVKLHSLSATLAPAGRSAGLRRLSTNSTL